VRGAVSLADGGYADTSVSRKVNIFDTANYFLCVARAEGANIMTILSLQKLCFYTQAWSLIWDHKPLFEEEFISGEYGPANFELSQKYNSYKQELYLEPDNGFNMDVFTEKQKDMMDAVWNAYGPRGNKNNGNISGEEGKK
jgi:Uncharacterized phage-associated protein